MMAGISLADIDRWPWLSRVSDSIAELQSSVCARSALRRKYRDVLRAARLFRNRESYFSGKLGECFYLELLKLRRRSARSFLR
jgi:hypothetical protein